MNTIRGNKSLDYVEDKVSSTGCKPVSLLRQLGSIPEWGTKFRRSYV
jgi:hypothetical protein